MESLKLNVLVIDQDQAARQVLKTGLKAFGCEMTAVGSQEEAIQLLDTQSFDLILMHSKDANGTGFSVAKSISDFRQCPLIVFLIENPTYETTVESIKAGAFDFLQKPVTLLSLEYMLTKIQKFILVHRENIALKLTRTRSDYFTGFTSQAMENLESFVKKISPTDVPLLITGENGTGKSLLARLIHQKSNRVLKPFVEFNCSTSSEHTQEGDLFGQVKSSVVPSALPRIGKFEAAEGGTLFLDEIGDLSLDAQARLHKFLQEKAIERVGSHNPTPVDTRLILATSKNLSEAVSTGKFREDLFYKMSLFETTIVPLRHRREDIEILVQRFIQEFNVRTARKNSYEMTDSLKNILLNYSWPGNVRELRNCLERLVLLAEAGVLSEQNLPEAIRLKSTTLSSSDEMPSYTTLENVEKEHIQRVLSTETNLEKAAEILGISTVTLWRKRKDYGLSASV